MTRCLRSSILRHLLASTVAAKATSPSFRNSAGWIVTGPRSIQRDAPYSGGPLGRMQGDQHQREDRDQHRHAQLLPRGVRQAPRHRHRDQPGHRVEELPVEVPEAGPVALHRRDRPGAEDHDQPEHGEHRGGDQQHDDARATRLRFGGPRGLRIGCSDQLEMRRRALRRSARRGALALGPLGGSALDRRAFGRRPLGPGRLTLPHARPPPAANAPRPRTDRRARRSRVN